MTMLPDKESMERFEVERTLKLRVEELEHEMWTSNPEKKP